MHGARTGHKRAPALRTTSSFLPVLLSCLIGCAGYSDVGPPSVTPRAPNVISLDPQDWYILYSAGMPRHPSDDSEGAWSFEFPNAGGHVNYLQTPFNSTNDPRECRDHVQSREQCGAVFDCRSCRSPSCHYAPVFRATGRRPNGPERALVGTREPLQSRLRRWPATDNHRGAYIRSMD